MPTSAEPSLLELCRVQPRLSKSRANERRAEVARAMPSAAEIIQISCQRAQSRGCSSYAECSRDYPNLVPTSAEPRLLELCRVQPRLSKSEFIELLSVLRTEILQILCKPNAEREPAHAMLRRSQDYPNLYKSSKSVEPDASAIRYAYQFQSRWSIFRMVSPRPKDRHH